MYVLNFRKNGALGLPTIRIIAHSNNDALNRALDQQLEFMPCDLMLPDETIFIPDTNDHGYELEMLVEHHKKQGTHFTPLFWQDVVALRDALGMLD